MLHLPTKRFCAGEPQGSFRALLLFRFCSYMDKTQQFHPLHSFPAAFELLNVLFICLGLIAVLHGHFVHFSCPWWWVSRQHSRLECCKGALKSHGTREKHPLVPLDAIILLKKKCLNQCVFGRSDVRVNGNAVNSRVLLIVNFSGRSCQLGWKAVGCFFFFCWREEVNTKCWCLKGLYSN